MAIDITLSFELDENGLALFIDDTTTSSVTAAVADPTVTGFSTAEGSIYLRTTGTLYIKTGPLDTDWDIAATEDFVSGGFQPLDSDLTALAGIATTGIYVITGSGTSTTRTIQGTTNRISLSNGDGVAGDPTVDIDVAYVGQTSITTLGTVTTGAWSATTIATTKGGTDLTSYTQGDLIYASAVNTLTQLAKDINTTRYLSNTGASNNPAWSQVDLTNGVSNDLPFSNLTQIVGLSVLGVTLTAIADVAAITGTTDQILRVDGAGTVLGFGSIDLSKAATVGVSILGTANGGTGNANGTIPLDKITAASGANSINNGDNAQTWNWALTTAAKTAFTFTENSAATNGAGAQFLVDVSTIAASTANPIRIQAQANDILTVTNVGVVTLQGADSAAGAAITIKGGTPTTATTTGSNATLIGGNGATSGTGGQALVTGGVGGTIGVGGAANITGGAGGTASGNAGGVAITGGTPVAGAGGAITISGSAGVGTNQNGGAVTIQAGAVTGTGTGSTITFNTNGATQVGQFTQAGSLVLGNAAVATNATDGFLYITTSAGTPAGTPTTFTGRAPIEIDTTNNLFYFYSTGAWRTAATTLQLYKENPSTPTTPLVAGTNAVAIGTGSSATATNSIAIGQGTNARIQGEKAFATGDFATAGDAQKSEIIMRNSTTNATTTELFVDGSTIRHVLPNNSAYNFFISLVARRTDATGGRAAYTFQGLIYRDANAASTAIQGGVTKTILAESNAAWDANVDADTTNGSLRIQVNGEAAKTIRWVAYVRTTEVTN